MTTVRLHPRRQKPDTNEFIDEVEFKITQIRAQSERTKIDNIKECIAYANKKFSEIEAKLANEMRSDEVEVKYPTHKRHSSLDLDTHHAQAKKSLANFYKLINATVRISEKLEKLQQELNDAKEDEQCMLGGDAEYKKLHTKIEEKTPLSIHIDKWIAERQEELQKKELPWKVQFFYKQKELLNKAHERAQLKRKSQILAEEKKAKEAISESYQTMVALVDHMESIPHKYHAKKRGGLLGKLLNVFHKRRDTDFVQAIQEEGEDLQEHYLQLSIDFSVSDPYFLYKNRCNFFAMRARERMEEIAKLSDYAFQEETNSHWSEHSKVHKLVHRRNSH